MLGNLRHLGFLYLNDNDLTGAVPSTLLKLPLRHFIWARSRTGEWDTGLCAPGTSGFVEWLAGLGDRSGPFCNIADEVVLTNLYELAGGGEWTESHGWLGGPALEEWHGVAADSLGRVTALDLSDNGLSGGLPELLAALVG